MASQSSLLYTPARRCRASSITPSGGRRGLGGVPSCGAIAEMRQGSEVASAARARIRHPHRKAVQLETEKLSYICRTVRSQSPRTSLRINAGLCSAFPCAKRPATRKGGCAAESIVIEEADGRPQRSFTVQFFSEAVGFAAEPSLSELVIAIVKEIMRPVVVRV